MRTSPPLRLSGNVYWISAAAARSRRGRARWFGNRSAGHDTRQDARLPLRAAYAGFRSCVQSAADGILTWWQRRLAGAMTLAFAGGALGMGVLLQV